MMENFFSLIIFIFGLIVGSFLNCIIYRLSLPSFSFKKIGGLKNRSYCPHCKHLLSWKDLVPLFSFLALKRKCRYCQKPISWQYPLVEISTGIIFLIIFNHFFGFNLLSVLYYWVISSFLIVIFVFDLKHYIIPDQIIYPAIGIALIFNFLISYLPAGELVSEQFSIFKFSIISAFLAGGFFLFIVLVSKGRWMGVGDIKLAFLMGLVLGFPNILVALFLAFFLGALVGLAQIAVGKKTLKSEVPFAPFLVTGTFLALFWGENFINFYLSLFFL